MSSFSRETIERLLAQAMEQGAIPPYVYTYPTRSAYRPLDPSWTIDEIWRQDHDNSTSRDLNLYLHVPFCRYKCGFCNLYTVTSTDQDLYTAYVEALCRQLELHRHIIQERNLRTVYIGGGTPSLLGRKHFDRLFGKISEIYPNWRNATLEVCLEATPDSIVDDPGNVKFLMDHGVTRLNVGMQSLVPAEIAEAGRAKAQADVIRRAVAIVKEAGLPNLSSDLIMGFSSQTPETWKQSVVELARLAPETISTYYLTVRPDAWFAGTGRYTYHHDKELYERYDFARETFLAAGYVQETNIRYKRQGRGGYLQKALQFQGVPYLGIGVGARTYTSTVDYILGGSATPSAAQVRDYMRQTEAGRMEMTAGFVYDDEERLRKRLVLNLFDFDLRDVAKYHPERHAAVYEDVFAAAIGLGLLAKVGSTRYQLTYAGYKYRDILSWLLFSERVRQLDGEFYRQLVGLKRRAGNAGDPATSQLNVEPAA